VEAYFRQNRWETFYHYFPLLYAISESTVGLTTDKMFGTIHMVGLEDEPDEQYFASRQIGRLDAFYQTLKHSSKVWIGPHRCPIDGWWDELYDVNYIYDLEYTLGIRNFRKNVKKFEKAHPDIRWLTPDGDEEGVHTHRGYIGHHGWEVVKQWYKISSRKQFTDFGYTEWLTLNLDEFLDLKPRLLCIDEKPVGFSLWDKLTEDTGIHLICKDVGWPYLQDYIRYRTYLEMKEAGLKYCNDGSDAGEAGIRAYKSKLRPRFIIPIYSWVREA